MNLNLLGLVIGSSLAIVAMGACAAPGDVGRRAHADADADPDVVSVSEAALMPVARGTPGICGGATPGIDYGRELVIRDLAVVEDRLRTRWPSGSMTPTDPEEGVWHLGRLMAGMVGDGTDKGVENEPYVPLAPPQFVRDWLGMWERDDSVNCDLVAARPRIEEIIASWPKKDGQLDLTQAPFRLLAIVRRADLVDLSPPGTNVRNNDSLRRDQAGAGELRFVFGLVDPRTNQPRDFTVILEYNVPAETDAEVGDQLARWHALAGNAPQQPLGPVAYRKLLASLTWDITQPEGATRCAGCTVGTRARPKDSNLIRLRTNDLGVLGIGQEFREFRLPLKPTHRDLQHFYLTQTPAVRHDETTKLGDYLVQYCAEIRDEHHKVPQEFEPYRGAGPRECDNQEFDAVQFQAGRSANDMRSYWDAPNLPPEVSAACGITGSELRFRFSRNTCNGCHGREQGMHAPTAQFFHIGPRTEGAEAPLSRFLAGPYAFIDARGGLRDHDEPKRRLVDYERRLCALR